MRPNALELNTPGWILTAVLILLTVIFAARGPLWTGLARLTSGPPIAAVEQ